MHDPTLNAKRPTPNASPPRYPAIILAAGMSRRMGRTKAVLPVAGTAMIRLTVDTCLNSGSVETVIVVTGYDSSKIREVLSDRPVKFAHNSDFEAGEMLSSVQVGIRTLPEDCTAFYLMPCDQPLLQASTFVALAERRLDSTSVVIPVFQGKRGHPVLISVDVIPDILSLKDDETLKTALMRYRDRSIEITVDDPGVLFDIDTPADYEVARACN